MVSCRIGHHLKARLDIPGGLFLCPTIRDYMPTKDPTTWAMSTWMLALGMALGGGMISWYSKLKQGHTRVFNIIELIGEIFTSALTGLGVFMALDAIDQPIGMCAAASGISGHMATRLLFAIEKAIESKINKLGD